MDLAERVFVFVIGGCAGFIFGYIVAHLRAIEKKLDAVDEHIIKQEIIVTKDETQIRTRDESGSWSPPGWFSFINVVSVLVVFLVAFAAWRSDQAVKAVEANTQADFVSVCAAGAEIREVQRQTIDAIFTLATQSLERPEGAKPLTDVELEQYNAYIDRLNFFRQDMYNKIEPTPKCAPYVADDNVSPPTPDFPHIKRKP